MPTHTFSGYAASLSERLRQTPAQERGTLRSHVRRMNGRACAEGPGGRVVTRSRFCLQRPQTSPEQSFFHGQQELLFRSQRNKSLLKQTRLRFTFLFAMLGITHLRCNFSITSVELSQQYPDALFDCRIYICPLNALHTSTCIQIDTYGTKYQASKSLNFLPKIAVQVSPRRAASFYTGGLRAKG